MVVLKGMEPPSSTVTPRRDGMEATALHLFRGLADSYDTVLDWATLFQDRYWKTWAIRHGAAPDGGLCLDLGCGTLVMEESLAGSGCTFVGLDLTREMVAIGKGKGLANVRLLVNGDAEALPFPDGAFDSVLSCYVPKYVRTSRLAAELARVARPGGVAVLYDFARLRGPLAPFLGLYARGGLRLAGALARLSRAGAGMAFDRLPDIIARSTWDEEIVPAMERRGFETVAAERLTGGVVFAYCGRKNPRI